MRSLAAYAILGFLFWVAILESGIHATLAGVVLGLLTPARHPVALGIVAGLVLGKIVGIVAASWLAVRLGLAKLPVGVSWGHVVGVAQA